jgi:ubiquinone/menaquinone biosynthesis C-methylase UbiE
MFTDPAKNLRAFGLTEEMIVADLGAGTGFYSILASAMVPKGKVYAIEIQKDFLITVKNKALDAKCNNVECLWGNIEKIGGTKLKNDIIDAVIISNVLFQVENKEKLIEEAKRILKTGGKILFIDWTSLPESFGSGLKTTIPKEKARVLFEEKGFIFKREIDAGAHHYGMILEKK